MVDVIVEQYPHSPGERDSMPNNSRAWFCRQVMKAEVRLATQLRRNPSRQNPGDPARKKKA
jgi:hypothetical protein